MTWTLPEGWSLRTVSPPGPSGSSPLFARVCPAWKLITEVVGNAPPAAKARMSPAADGSVTVTLAEMARAVAGIPHVPVTAKVRVPPALIAGPPRGPGGLRVSITRHG